MTNREIINRLKELGFEDSTEPRYWTYETFSGTMRQRLQDDVLDFTKKYGNNTITIGVENDRWSFNGLTDDDVIKTNSTVWLNHNFDNEDLVNAGAVIDIEEEGDSLIFDVRKRNKNSYTTYRMQKKITFDEYEEDDDFDYDDEDEDIGLATDDRQAGQWYESKKSDKSKLKVGNIVKYNGKSYIVKQLFDGNVTIVGHGKAITISPDRVEKIFDESKKSDKSRLREGTWELPDTVEKAQAILDLMKEPLPSSEASHAMYNLYGDDKLFDCFFGKQKDVRYYIKRAIRSLVEDIEANPNSWRRGNTPIVWPPEAIEILKKVASYDVY